MWLEIIALVLILILSFGILILLSESLSVILFFSSGLIGIFSALNLIPNYFLVVGLIIFAYSVYSLIWGTNN